MKCEEFYNLLAKKEINFFCGVPDSLLKDLCSYIADNAKQEDYIIAANEGNAVALTAGYYLATGKMGVVYMQNSGIGNAINPLVSLVDPEVYSIPMLLVIGWRGEPGIKDEPQHIKQGKITLKLMDGISVPFSILPASIEEAEICINDACNAMNKNKSPYAIIVRKGIFEKYSPQVKIKNNYEASREDAIKIVADCLESEDIIISTTGKASRELFEYRNLLNQDHCRDFLTVGSMGHSSQIALGIALKKPDKKIYCLDGDGAAIMHMGSLAVIGSKSPANFKHIILNNGSHESVGGQPTAGFDIDFNLIAKACGYKNVFSAITIEEIKQKIYLLKSSEGPSLLEIRVNVGSRKDLGRPNISPIENKEDFIKFLRK